MHPTLVREPFHRDAWVYEEKYDGWRMLAYEDGTRVRLTSRHAVDHTAALHRHRGCRGRAARADIDGEKCEFSARSAGVLRSPVRGAAVRRGQGIRSAGGGPADGPVVVPET